MEKRFSRYVNSTCNPEEFSTVVGDLCAQDDNGSISADMLELWKDTLADTVEKRENNQLLDKIHHRIALEESITVSRNLTLYKNLLRVAAVLIIGLVFHAILLYDKPEKQIYNSVIETVTTPYGARTNFKLPDGTEVWLNSGSTISYPNQFAAVRNVQLTGQAYFKVVKDGKPFVVNTSSGNIEVMGTSIDVKAYLDEDFAATLVEGSVKVIDRGSHSAILKPGQQMIITPENKSTLNVVNTHLITSWKDGRLIFEKEPFQNVARELERWYNVKIELRGDKLKKLGYTGTIEQETFSEVLELINTTAAIQYKFDKRTRILKISRRYNPDIK